MTWTCLTARRTRRPAAALAVLCLPAWLGAQAAAGAPIFRPNVIRPYTTTWKFTVTRPDGARIVQGLWSDLVDTIRVNGRLAMRRVQGAVYVNGLTSSTVNVYDAATMRPISSTTTRVRSGERITRTFSDDAMVTRRLAPDGTPIDSSRIALSGPVYDYAGGTYGNLLAALPLRAGLEVSFRSIAEFADSVQTVTVQVLGRDSADAGGGRMVPAWKVREGMLTFWIADGPPYVLRLEMHGAGGLLTTWEIPG